MSTDDDQPDLFAYLSIERLRHFEPSSAATFAEAARLSTDMSDRPALRGYHLALLDHCLALGQLAAAGRPPDPALLAVLDWFAESGPFRRLTAGLSARLRFRDLARLCRLLECAGGAGADSLARALIGDHLIDRIKSRLLQQLLTGAPARRLAPCLARCRFVLRRDRRPSNRQLLIHCRQSSDPRYLSDSLAWRDCLLRCLLASLQNGGRRPLPPRLAAHCLLGLRGPAGAPGSDGDLRCHLTPLACGFARRLLRLAFQAERPPTANVLVALRPLAEAAAADPRLLAEAADRLSAGARHRLWALVAPIATAGAGSQPWLLGLLHGVCPAASPARLSGRLLAAERLATVLAGPPISAVDPRLAGELAALARRRLRRCLAGTLAPEAPLPSAALGRQLAEIAAECGLPDAAASRDRWRQLAWRLRRLRQLLV